jgi:hypothetical protein
MPFKKENRNWTEYRNLPNLIEVDFHRSGNGQHHYWDSMEQVMSDALSIIKSAYESKQICHVLFTHGWSTSRRGKTTTRSQIRTLMRSKEATPYIDRKLCIQHDSIFVAAIRKR